MNEKAFLPGTVIGSRLTDELKKAYTDYTAAGALIRFDKQLDTGKTASFGDMTRLS